LPTVAAPPPGDGSAGLGAAGRALWRAHVEALDDWTPRDLALLRQAAEARDRQVAFQRTLKADGLVVEGKPHPVVRAERQTAALIVTALRALDIRPAPALPAKRRA
jgi:hypothetical protein